MFTNEIFLAALRGIFTEARYLEAYLCGNFNREIDLSNIMPLFLMNPIFQVSHVKLVFMYQVRAEILIQAAAWHILQAKQFKQIKHGCIVHSA